MPSRILGHAQPEGLTVTNCSNTVCSPNLVEGRELWAPSGLALDTTASPPILYVADTGNNRVLAWKNGTSFTSGAPADLVIGQPDRYTTAQGGPGTTYSAGLYNPTGLAVYNGDLYITDSGNNRVLRFPQPFANANQQVPNLVIGQQTLSTRLANYPAGKPTANGISLFSGSGTPLSANIAFDNAGNLWFTDAGNRRVLRFPAAAIAANPAMFPAADFQLGWTGPTDFTDAPAQTLAVIATAAYSTTQFYVPAGIAFDAAGRLYVTDADPNYQVNRVLVFTLGSPINGVPQIGAVKIMGLPPQSGSPPTQAIFDQTLVINPSGVILFPDPKGGQDAAVLDTASSRIVIFPPYETWTDPLVAPPASQVIGHNGDFSNRNPDNAPLSTISPAASAGTFNFPSAGAFFKGQLYVADSLNNRVMVMPLSGTTVGAATAVLGQARLDTGSPNYIDGREFQFASGDAGIAVDYSSGTPHLYIADPSNHRVLGFNDLRTAAANVKADIVIGQPDLQTAICNYSASSPGKGGNRSSPNQSSLCGPVGIAVDSQGNLYVADTGNGRVLRFPKPFAFSGNLEPADLVLGQKDFVSQFTDPSQFNMAQPYGVAFSGVNGLVVSDLKDNRVLYFPATNGNFTNGQAAGKVFGQGQFLSITAGTDQGSLNAPHSISCDSSGRIYVADTGNNRVQIFHDPNNPNTPARGDPAIFSITNNLNAPHGVYVNATTGEIWVADTNNSQAKRYGSYPDQLEVSSGPTAQVPAAAPALAVAQDQFGDLILADFSHRIAIYFPGLEAVNGASFLVTRALAPGMVASLCSPGSNNNTATACVTGAPAFGGSTGTAMETGFPLPTTLADTQVLFNSIASPLYYVSPSQINFVVPNGQNAGDVPTSGTAEVQVIRASTGQVLAAGSVPMNAASPGILQGGYSGTVRQAAVLSEDGSANGPSNQAARGSVIQIFATGAGFIPGAPPDGVPAGSPIPTPSTPTVIIGSCLVDDTACTGEPPGNVKYSGLSGFPGVWQINVRIPMNTAPGTQVPLFIGMNDIYSTDPSSGFRMVIGVK
ncbi:MAG: hypothetical protein JO323_17570 [Acidobacteriia bacterium]|nr:hypothetical protein [Terriglobia bacterium]